MTIIIINSYLILKGRLRKPEQFNILEAGVNFCHFALRTFTYLKLFVDYQNCCKIKE